MMSKYFGKCTHFSLVSIQEVSVMSESTVCLNVPSRLEKAIEELQRLHEMLLSGDLDSHILADFRDALNRVRNTAWAAQQYVARKETGQL